MGDYGAAVIGQIRREKFWLDRAGEPGERNPLIDDLQASVQHLSEGLYSKETHFVLELIQNAEDNAYDEHVTPRLSMELLDVDPLATPGSEGALVISNNERGFRPADVKALCAVGASTKKARKHSAAFIGDKGIGFKSVFVVSARPAIFSNGFHFCFNEEPEATTGLGYIVPTAIPSVPEAVRPHLADKHTVILLPLKPGKRAKVERELASIAPETLLFLHKVPAAHSLPNPPLHTPSPPLYALSLSSRSAGARRAHPCFVRRPSRCLHAPDLPPPPARGLLRKTPAPPPQHKPSAQQIAHLRVVVNKRVLTEVERRTTPMRALPLAPPPAAGSAAVGEIGAEGGGDDCAVVSLVTRSGGEEQQRDYWRYTHEAKVRHPPARPSASSSPLAPSLAAAAAAASSPPLCAATPRRAGRRAHSARNPPRPDQPPGPTSRPLLYPLPPYLCPLSCRPTSPSPRASACSCGRAQWRCRCARAARRTTRLSARSRARGASTPSCRLRCAPLLPLLWLACLSCWLFSSLSLRVRFCAVRVTSVAPSAAAASRSPRHTADRRSRRPLLRTLPSPDWRANWPRFGAPGALARAVSTQRGLCSLVEPRVDSGARQFQPQPCP